MSILGTLGPLVQGSKWTRSDRIWTAAAFGVTFVAGAVAMFGGVYLLGSVLGVGELPVGWKLTLAGGGLVALAGVDVLSIWSSRYCPIGWSRQTPKALVRRHHGIFVAAVWGLDTGLAVTTFRVAAITWGALLLAAFGLVPWWIGLGYGLGFAVPFLVLLGTHRVGRCARQSGPADPGLDSMIGRRAAVQAVSALLLVTGAGVLLFDMGI